MVLRNEHDVERGSRWLAVEIDKRGDLVVRGQDLGPGVEAILGAREYEWQRRIAAVELGRVLAAFGVADPEALLAELARRFSGERAAALDEALAATGATIERWSRVGD